MADENAQSSSSGASQSASTQASAQDGGSQQAQTQQAVKVERPGYVPESFWDGDKGAVKADDFTRHFNELTAHKAAADVRRNSLPKPEAYAVKLPGDFKPPEGMQFAFRENDPLIGHLRTFAHEAGLDQTQFERGLGLYAAARVGEQQEFATAKAAELQKLGPNATARVNAVADWFKAMVPGKADSLAAVLTMAPRADVVEALEELVKTWTTQGGQSFSQQHRAQPGNDGKIPGYATMSFEQRRAAVDAAKRPANGTR